MSEGKAKITFKVYLDDQLVLKTVVKAKALAKWKELRIKYRASNHGIRVTRSGWVTHRGKPKLVQDSPFLTQSPDSYQPPPPSNTTASWLSEATGGLL